MSKEKVLFNPSTLRNLADKSYEKRKTAAIEIESLVRQLSTQPGSGQYINSIISTLVTDYTFSALPNCRKGGLIGLSSIAIALLHHASPYLELLLPPVLRCFVDQDPRVRYYACESLYNITKICRADILLYLNELFDGLCKLSVDQDQDVRVACMLFDRLLKDIVSTCDAFNVAHFIPLLRERIKLKHPHVRLLIVNWITLLNGLFDVTLLEFLPDLLGGLLAMLSDPHKDVKAQTVSILQTFLQQITKSKSIEFTTMVFPIVQHSTTNDRTTRAIVISWLHNFITLAPTQLLPFLPHLIGALFCCIHDQTSENGEIKQNALHCNEILLHVVKNAPLETANNDFPTLISHFISQLSSPLLHARIVALQWLSLLQTKYDSELFPFFDTLLPPFLLALQSECDIQVFILLIECIARLALLTPPLPQITNVPIQTNNKNDNELTATTTTTTNTSTITTSTSQSSLNNNTTSTLPCTSHLDKQLPPHFLLVFVNLLSLFATDVKFLELRSQRIICSLSTFIPPRHIFAAFCQLLAHNQDLLFTKVIVETLHMVLFTTEECAPLRQILIESTWNADYQPLLNTIFSAFFHSPIPSISLALLTSNYALASGIISYLTSSSNFQISIGLLLQLEQFVQLFESAIFSHCRCHLLSTYSLPIINYTNNDENGINTTTTQKNQKDTKSTALVESNTIIIDAKLDQIEETNLHREHIQALLHVLYSLLALLPQSHCFFTLKNRLDTSTVAVQPFIQAKNNNTNGDNNNNNNDMSKQLVNVNSTTNSTISTTSPLTAIHDVVSKAVRSFQTEQQQGDDIITMKQSQLSLKARMEQQIKLVEQYVIIQKKHDLFHIKQQQSSFLTPGR